MKKIFLFLLLLALAPLNSCSDDDEQPDRIIGNWILEEVNPATAFDPSACPNNSTVQIDGDYTLTANFYFDQNNCVLSSGEGTWERTGNSTYTLVLPEVGTITGTVNFTSADNFIFTAESGLEMTFRRQL